jgi:hypothetical protein
MAAAEPCPEELDFLTIDSEPADCWADTACAIGIISKGRRASRLPQPQWRLASSAIAARWGLAAGR